MFSMFNPMAGSIVYEEPWQLRYWYPKSPIMRGILENDRKEKKDFERLLLAAMDDIIEIYSPRITVKHNPTSSLALERVIIEFDARKE